MILLGYNSGKQIELHFRGFYQECLDEKIIKNDGSDEREEAHYFISRLQKNK